MEMLVGDIVFSSGNSWISRVIKWFQDSEWSHVEVVVHTYGPFYLAASAEMNGMEIKARRIHPKGNKRIAICRVDVDQETLHEGINYLFELCQSNVRYDYEGLIGYAFARIFGWAKNKWQNPKAAFCSEVTADFLKLIHFSSINDIPSAKISPKKLWFYLYPFEIKQETIANGE